MVLPILTTPVRLPRRPIRTILVRLIALALLALPVHLRAREDLALALARHRVPFLVAALHKNSIIRIL